jgi:hypothetical protein
MVKDLNFNSSHRIMRPEKNDVDRLIGSYNKRVTVLFDPLNSLGEGCMYFPSGEMPRVLLRVESLPPMNLVVDHPDSFSDSAMKHMYLSMLGKKGYNIPTTVFRERKGDPITVVTANSIKKLSVDESFECLQSEGVKEIVIKPTYGGGGMLVDFQNLNYRNFKAATEKSPSFIIQSRIPSKGSRARDYRFMIIDNKCCASYSRRSDSSVDLTNLARGGVSEKIEDSKVAEELGKLAEKITMEFNPSLKFASVDFLEGKDNFYLGEVHRFGKFEWEGYGKVYGNDDAIVEGVCSMVERNIGVGAVGWIPEPEPIPSYLFLRWDLSSKFPLRSVDSLKSLSPRSRFKSVA